MSGIHIHPDFAAARETAAVIEAARDHSLEELASDADVDTGDLIATGRSAADLRADFDLEHIPLDVVTVLAMARKSVREMDDEIDTYMNGINSRTDQAQGIRDDIVALERVQQEHPRMDGDHPNRNHPGIDLDAPMDPTQPDGMKVRDYLEAHGYSGLPSGQYWDKSQSDAALEQKKTMLQSVNAGSETDMIHLQAIIASRGQRLQLASAILNKLDRVKDSIVSKT